MKRLAILLACFVAAVSLAACGKGNDPPANNADNKGDSADAQEKMRQFAQCMRDHGIDMKDPETITEGDGSTRQKMELGTPPSGAPGAAGGPGGRDEKFQKAEEECKHLLPAGGDLGNVSPEDEENMRNMAKCMRENGVENFPDPQPGGGIAIGPETGINPDDPVFKEAEKKCEALMPKQKEKTTS